MDDEKITVANVWNKHLAVGDVILSIDMRESRYGPLRNYTVERTKESNYNEMLRQKAEQDKKDEEF